MTLPVSGAISMLQVRTELGASGAISLGQASVRALAGVASGAISLNVLHGKANAFAATISAHQTNLNLRTWALANGWNGSSAASITIASGIYIYATSVGTAGLTIDGSWPNGITLINNGYIMGMGGTSYTSTALPSVTVAGTAGNPGGNAISLGVSCTITNNSYIAGGGGSGAFAEGKSSMGGSGAPGGGGAGGGSGNYLYSSNGFYSGNVAGGAGGGIGASGGNASATPYGADYGSGSGGGGRILPGVGGIGAKYNQPSAAATGGGAGGGGAHGSVVQYNPNYGGPVPIGHTLGGGGGGWGASGGGSYTTSAANWTAGSGGSGGGAAVDATGGGTKTLRASGGAGGKAVALNGFSITWAAVGTRYGAIA